MSVPPPISTPALAPVPTRRTSGLTPDGAVVRYFRVQVRELHRGEQLLRAGDDDVHDARVALRRLRSTVRLLKGHLDPAEADLVQQETSWYAAALGPVRDARVQHELLTAMVDELPAELVMGRVRGQLADRLLSAGRAGRSEVVELLDSDRYHAMMVLLGRWAVRPPWTDPLTSKELRRRTRRAGRKADRRLRRAVRHGSDAELHGARKAAKRARYAAELTAGHTDDKRLRRERKDWKHLQEILGGLQDAAVGRETLRLLGAASGERPDQNGFTFGLLHARLARLADAARVGARRWARRHRR